MGKNNKARRIQKKRTKARRSKRKNERRRQRNIKDDFYSFTQLPNPFSGMSEDERVEAAVLMGKHARELYSTELSSLNRTLRTYDPLQLLSMLSMYGLTVGITKQNEFRRPSVTGFNQSQVELLSALMLRLDIAKLGKQPVTPDVVQSTFDSLASLPTAFAFSRMGNEKRDNTPGSMRLLQEQIRSHTQTVRNWGYASQVQSISHELYSFFDKQLLAQKGFGANQIFAVFNSLSDLLIMKVNARHEFLSDLFQSESKEKMVYKYHELTGHSRDEACEFLNKLPVSDMSNQHLFLMLWAHYDLTVRNVCTFKISKIAELSGVEHDVVNAVCEQFSYTRGGLAEFPEEHLFLGNPVWKKPLIQLKKGDVYFCPSPHSFFSFVFPALDSLIEPINKRSLHERRATYLEEKIREIVCRRFPESKTVSGLKWHWKETEYETDLITCIDSHLLIVEAKSARVTEQALRGAEARLKKHIEELIVAPSIQSKRLQDRLFELIKTPDVNDELCKRLPVDLTDIKVVLRVSVSLDDFAVIHSTVKEHMPTGLFPEDFVPCPTMNLADFETLFDLLDHPVQIIHYLSCRSDIEAHRNCLGDEIDFLGFYISTLFHQGYFPPNSDDQLVLTGDSKEIDHYYDLKDAGIDVKKPKPYVCNFFREVFFQLEKKSPPRWSEIGVVLNNFSPKDQRKLERKLRDGIKMVRRDPVAAGEKNILILVQPPPCEHSLAIVLFKNENKERRYEFVDTAAQLGLQEKHIRSCLVVAKNIDDPLSAYAIIGLVEDGGVVNHPH